MERGPADTPAPATPVVAPGEPDVGLAVAAGTFSLPVALPGGGVQKDFQGTSPRPAVTLWAIDSRLTEGAAATLWLALAALLAWLIAKLVAQFRRRELTPRGLAAAYAAVAAVLACLVLMDVLGLFVGIVLAAVLLCPTELVHRLLNRRAARG
jgi:hypothetical protein